MKKITIFMFIAVLIAGTAFAQPIKKQREAELRSQQERPNRQEKVERRMLPQSGVQKMQGQQQNRQRPDNSVSVEGTLKLEKGFVSVQSGESVYLVPRLNRYIGFIDGLKEGAKVSVEGRSFRNMIQPLKVTIGEKSYDFIAPPRGSNFNHRFDNKKFGHKFEKCKFDHGKNREHDKGGRRNR